MPVGAIESVVSQKRPPGGLTLSALVDGLVDIAMQAFAAGFGAWAAFRFEARREARSQEGDDADAIREALFALLSQRNFLLNLNKQLIEPFAQHPERFLVMPALAVTPAFREITLTRLTFLLGTEHAGVLSDIDLADARFKTFVSTLETRNRLHLELQERMSRAAPERRTATLEELTAVVGPAIVKQLRDATESLCKMGPLAAKDNETAYALLEEALRKLYPEARVPKLQEAQQSKQIAPAG